MTLMGDLLCAKYYKFFKNVSWFSPRDSIQNTQGPHLYCSHCRTHLGQCILKVGMPPLFKVQAIGQYRMNVLANAVSALFW